MRYIRTGMIASLSLFCAATMAFALTHWDYVNIPGTLDIYVKIPLHETGADALALYYQTPKKPPVFVEDYVFSPGLSPWSEPVVRMSCPQGTYVLVAKAATIYCPTGDLVWSGFSPPSQTIKAGENKKRPYVMIPAITGPTTR